MSAPESFAVPRLRRLVQHGTAAQCASWHRTHCELCGEPLGCQHRHLLELLEQELRCACRGCARLLDRHRFGTGACRLVPRRLWLVEDFAVDDLEWSWLGIPGAAFVGSSRVGEASARFAGPGGLERRRLDDGRWRRILARHPAFETLEPEVEAVLVHRFGAAREHWIAPLDLCLDLFTHLAAQWTAPGAAQGGERVWRETEALFAAVRREALPVGRPDLERALGVRTRPWPRS